MENLYIRANAKDYADLLESVAQLQRGRCAPRTLTDE
jgi:hypothetical protein